MWPAVRVVVVGCLCDCSCGGVQGDGDGGGDGTGDDVGEECACKATTSAVLKYLIPDVELQLAKRNRRQHNNLDVGNVLATGYCFIKSIH